jgi:type I restriction enzyme S subunit
MSTGTEWTTGKIGDICVVGDGAHAKIGRQTSGVMYLTSKNLKDGRLDISQIDYISETDFNKHFRDNSKALTRIKPNDVIFSIIGTIGEPYLVNSIDRFGISSSVAILRPNKSDLSPKYLFYWIKNHIFQDALYAIKGGVAQGYVSLEMIRSLPLYYPALSTQQKIASIISAYDDLIENNTRRVKILEEMAQTIYNEWFVKFGFPGHENVKMVESELGMIPEGWEIKKLGDVAEQKRRSVNPNSIDLNTPYFGLEHLPRRSIALSEWGSADDVKSTKYKFKVDEILFGKIRPYFHKVGVSPVEGICSSDIIVISVKDNIFYPIVLGCVSSDDFVAHATKTSNGTKMPRANWDVLVKYPLFIPPLELVLKYNEFVENIVEQICNFVLRNRNLLKTRDLLLPRLISGEIDVSELFIIAVSYFIPIKTLE